MSKKQRSALLVALVVFSVLSLATMGCGGADGDSFLKDVIEGEKQNWKEVGESVTGPKPSNKDSGFVGSPGKVICELRGHTWVASIDACYESK